MHSPLLKFSYLYFFTAAITLLVVSGCQEDKFLPSGASTAVSEVDDRGFYRFPEVPYGPGPTKLGRKLANPYNLENMRQAAALLSVKGGAAKSAGNIQPTHVYLKMMPASGEMYVAITDAAEKHNVTFQDQPIEYEVLHQGEEGYRDPTAKNDALPQLYGAVTTEQYEEAFKKLPHEVIEELHIPKYETQLTFAAYVISGNEKDYEAVDEYCHPDCPNWPACLDEPELACSPDVAPAKVGTLFPVDYGESRTNFPAYIQDAAMGLNGEIQPFSGLMVCDDIINTRPNCPDGQHAVLNPIGHEPGACRWECVTTGGGGGGGDNDPNASTCGCQTSTNRKRPGGKMILVDTQLGDEGIRRAKVRTTKYRWGFIWSATDTDDEGCWRINSTYNVKRGKVQIVFKDRTSNRMVIRSLRGARVHNAFLEAVDFTWYLTRDDERWNNLCLRITDDTRDNQSLQEQTFVAATTNNAVHEYYDDHSSLPSPGKIAVLIHTLNSSLNAAPMFKEMDQDQISVGDVGNWFIAYSLGFTGPIYTYWQVAKPDVFLFYGDGRRSDRFKNIAYHEMMHVSQYDVFGPNWWEQYVSYIGRVALTSQPAPYGDGSTFGFGRAEVTEGMAEAAGNRFAGAKYGVRHSRLGAGTRNFYDRRSELQTFWNQSSDFIPEGLFYDLLDDNANPVSNIGTGEARGINDPVRAVSFEKQLRACTPFVFDIPGYKNSLIQREAGSVNSTSELRTLFSSYGH